MTEKIIEKPAPGHLAMVPFVSVENMMRIVNEAGVGATIAAIAERIEVDFRRWPLFDKTPRVAAHSPDGVIELMPTSDGEFYGFKYVNGHPANMARGFPAPTAFGILACVDNGYPVMLSEMTVLTALRTASTSVDDHEIPRTEGCHHHGDDRQRRAVRVSRWASTRFSVSTRSGSTISTRQRPPKPLRNLEGTGLRVVSCISAQEAIEGAQIITTCTADKKQATILTDNMVGAGVHLNAIGGDCPGKTELHRDILLRSDIFVEFPPQTWVEGEIQQLSRIIPSPNCGKSLKAPLPDVPVTAKYHPSIPFGFAMEDFSALRFIHDQMEQTGHYVELDMLADPDDPRDLYGMLRRAE